MKKKIYFLALALSISCFCHLANSQTVTDIDGNVYNTLTIGTQTWMKENLKVTKYRNGDSITTTTATIPNDSTSIYQWAYNNDSSNVNIYGRLYTWWTVSDSQTVCPVDWHLPSDAEWTTLTDYLGGDTIAGGKMKEAGTSNWSSPNTGADNSSNFTALPGGHRVTNAIFYAINYGANWWTATEDSSLTAYGRGMGYNVASITRKTFNKSVGFSVRCLSDKAAGFNEIPDNSNFNFYPNPGNGRFNVLISDVIAGKTKIEIYNLMGEIVFKQQNKNEIDLSNSPKGIYFLKIHDGEKIYYQKIVVQ